MMILAAFILAFIYGSVLADQDGYIYPCYFTNWAQYRHGSAKFETKYYQPGLCTHIFYAFAKIDPITYETAFVEWNDDQLYKEVLGWKTQQPGLKVLLSFGGWTLSAPFPIMAKDPAKRRTFIQSAVRHVRTHNFDGIDIDWEYPDANSKNDYTQFIKDLDNAIKEEAKTSGKERLLLTAAVSASASKIDAGYDVPAIEPYFDFLLVMSYDLHGSWDPVTGLHCGLYAPSAIPNEELTVSNAMEHWNMKGIPAKKLILGIPTYGKGFTLSNPAVNGIGASANGASEGTSVAREPGTIFFIELCKKFNSGTRVVDSSAKTPYLVDGNQWFTYDDEESILTKIDYVKKKGFGGVFTWALDLDDFNGLNCGIGKYPLISLFSRELAGGQIPEETTEKPDVTVPTVKPTEPEVSPTEPEATTKPSEPEVTPTEPETTTEPTEVKPTLTPGGDFVCPEQYGYFPDPNDCRAFYQCSFGNSYHHVCPPGLYFDQAAQVCNYMVNGQCPQ